MNDRFRISRLAAAPLALSLAAGALALCTAPAVAHADPATPSASGASGASGAPVASGAPSRTEARERFNRGLQLFDDNDVAGALAEFKRAYDIAPRPGVLYNIALAYTALNDPAQAVDALDKLLATPNDVFTETIARAKKLRTEQAARVAEVDVITAVAGTRIEVDNIEAGTTPLKRPLRVSSGNHVIGAFAPGYAPSRQSVTVAGGTHSEAHFDLIANEARLSHLVVQSATPDAVLAANGETLGKTPLAASLTLLPGHYNLELRRPGYKTAHTEVTLGDGATGEVHLDLDEEPGHASSLDGTLTLRPSEPDSVYFVDGALRGEYRGSVQLPGGLHHIKMEHAGFIPSEHDVTIPTGKSTELKVHLFPTNETREDYESSARGRRTLGWIVTGAGVLIAGGSIAYYAINKSTVTSAQNQFNDISKRTVKGSNQDCDPAGAHATTSADECVALYSDANDRLNAAKLRQNLSFVGMGVGGATAVVGVILLLTGPDVHKYDHETASNGFTLRPFGAPSLRGGGTFGLQGTF